MRRIGLAALVVFVVGAACEKKDETSGSNGAGATLLSDLDEIAVDSTGRVLAFSMASAPNAFMQSYLPVLSADISLQLGGDCPVKVESGSTTTYTGGCTDDDGQTWSGSASLEQGASGASIEYDAFGFSSTTSCGGMGYPTSTEWNGRLEMGGMPTPGGAGTFETDLRVDVTGLDEDDCTTSTYAWAFDYAGTFEEGPDGDGDSEPDAQIYSGDGEFGILMVSGDPTLEGRVSAETVDEIVVTTFTSDTSFTLCQTEALSGSTTIEAGGHTTVITYDGDLDCDADSTVTWTLDGTAQAELAGVGCSMAATRSSTGGGIAFVLLGGVALLVLRRAKR